MEVATEQHKYRKTRRVTERHRGGCPLAHIGVHSEQCSMETDGECHTTHRHLMDVKVTQVSCQIDQNHFYQQGMHSRWPVMVLDYATRYCTCIIYGCSYARQRTNGSQGHPSKNVTQQTMSQHKWYILWYKWITMEFHSNFTWSLVLLIHCM